jgi:hypothetical protein
MPTLPELAQRDDRVPMLLTLCVEHGNEIESATAPTGERPSEPRQVAGANTNIGPGLSAHGRRGGDGAQR